MTYGANAGAGAAVAAAAINEAHKAIGPIVVLEGRDFLALLEKIEDPVLVHSSEGFFTKNKYITSCHGLTFFAKTKDPLTIPASVVTIKAKKISIPSI